MHRFFQLVKKWIYYSSVFDLSKKQSAIIIALGLVMSLSEVIGISVFLPIFQYMRLDGKVFEASDTSEVWVVINNIFLFFNLELNLASLLIAAFLLLSLRQIVNYIGVRKKTRVQEGLQKGLKDQIYSNYLKSSSNFQDRTIVGNLINLITIETNKAILGLMSPLELISNFILVLFYITTLVIISFQITLISILIFILSVLFVRKWIARSRPIGQAVVAVNSKIGSFLVEKLSFYKLIRISGTENQEENFFRGLTRKQFKLNISQTMLEARTNLAIEPLVISVSLAFLYFSHTVYRMSIESIGLYFIIVLRLLPLVKSMLAIAQRIQKSLGSMEIIKDEINKIKSNQEETVGDNPVYNLSHEIVFKDVSYTIGKHKKKILKNINFSIEANSITAIVGPSGSGKSTLVDLIPMLKIPTSGNIYFDGVSIKLLNLTNLRRIISYLPQKAQIFNGTIREHIQYGNPNCSDDEIKKSLFFSGFNEFVSSLDNGIDAIIGNKGIKLSGGQERRLDLARSLVGSPSILIFDEPASGLDPHAEEDLRLSINEIHKKLNITIIIISHKLSFISNADKINILQLGEIVSSGTHRELIKNSDWYSKSLKFQNDT